MKTLNLIPRDIMEEPDNCEIPDQNVYYSDDNLSDISNSTNNSDNTESNILQSILNELVKIDHKEVWSRTSPRMLCKYYLADAQAVGESFLYSELN